MLDKETILKVLALFDDDDIQYIHSDKLDESIKQEYIEALPYLVVEDIAKVKTELDIVKDENVVLKEQNERYKELVDSIDERIERKIFEAMKVGLSDDELDDLFS